MRKSILLATFCAGLCGATIAEAAVLSATFDSDAEGWTGNPGQGVLTYHATGGNSGGHIRIRDVGVGTNNGFPSGGYFGNGFAGDLSAFDGGLLSLDMATFAQSGGPFTSFGTVFVRGTNGDFGAFDIGGPPALNVWSGYSAAFDAATFGKSQSDWDAILADVDWMAISTDAFDGADTIGIDNVSLGMPTTPAIPLPSGIVLMATALGVFAIGRRKAG